MSGVINRLPLPDESAGVFYVTPVGTTLALTVADPSLTCYLPDGTTRPSQVGDVLSWQPFGPGGTWQARQAGTSGAYEQVHINENVVAAYFPAAGFLGRFLYTGSVPNV